MTAKSHASASCVDEHDNNLSVEQALERIITAAHPVQGFERLAIRSALGRILAEDILSPINVPSHTNSAMDGYALNSIDLPQKEEAELTVIGTASAGHPYDGVLQPGQCIRIMTGAVMPEGADTVIMQEHVQREDDSIHIGTNHRPGQNVRQAGEDLSVGQCALSQGRQLTPADLGLLASLGIGEVTVKRRLRAAFFSTGDELRSIGEPLDEGCIYDSNRYTMHGMLSRLGVEIIDMGIVRDRREDIEQAFMDAAAIADVVLTSGGASVGEADYVAQTLEKLGQVKFWKIAMKPGRPLAFGTVNKAIFFGLPGNPVSAMATFYQFVQPTLRHMMGAQQIQSLRLQVPCCSPLKKRPGRTDFQRGILEHNSQGQLVVRSTGSQGSHILNSMSQANCFIILPTESGGAAAGDMVEVQPFAGLI